MTNRLRRTTTRCSAATVLLALFLGIFAALTPGVAGAHSADQSYVYLDVTDSSLSGRIEFPFEEMREVFGLELEGSDDELVAELDANAELLQAYADDHFDIGAGGQIFPVSFDGFELLFEENGGTDLNFALLAFEVELNGAEVPRDLEVTFDPFFDEVEDHTALLLIANDWEGGVLDNGGEALVGFDSGDRFRTIDLGDTSQWKNFTASIEGGVDHIKTGPDHILFVLVLLVPSVLVFSTRWEPSATFGASLWRVLKIATMFTIAHSITFTLAGMDWLPLPPSKLVETIIALSIAAAALHNIRPIAKNKEWVIAFAFGLFHGMGFASLVEGLDVSRSTQLVSLLGRNVGIEIGQAAVILFAFPALFLLRRTRFYRPFFVGSSILLAVIAIGWMIERVWETDLGIASFVDPALEFPRSLIWVVIATAVAGALYLVEQSAGRLLPVYGEVEAEVEPPAMEDELVPV